MKKRSSHSLATVLLLSGVCLIARSPAVHAQPAPAPLPAVGGAPTLMASLPREPARPVVTPLAANVAPTAPAAAAPIQFPAVEPLPATGPAFERVAAPESTPRAAPTQRPSPHGPECCPAGCGCDACACRSRWLPPGTPAPSWSTYGGLDDIWFNAGGDALQSTAWAWIRNGGYPRGFITPFMAPRTPMGLGRVWGEEGRQLTGFWVGGLARANYINDQRIQWSGQEETFGVEGQLSPHAFHASGDWLFTANSTFFFNQPFDRNMLSDPMRQSYLANFRPDPFQIWQLNLKVQRGNLTTTIGKDTTPFGRYYFPIYSNARFDAPFIRTEAIRWVETGAFLHYTPGIFVIDAALANGTPDRDTNSSKALVARVGMQTAHTSCGASIKIQDGFGSEQQKTFNNHIGVDGLVRYGAFDISGEAIYDQYGLRRGNEFSPDQIFWGRSIYYRDIWPGHDRSIHGFGYYVNVGYTSPLVRLDFNFGEYYPEVIGNAYNDTPIRRAIFKGGWRLSRRFEFFHVLLLENRRPVERWRAAESPSVVMVGFQMYL